MVQHYMAGFCSLQMIGILWLIKVHAPFKTNLKLHDLND